MEPVGAGAGGGSDPGLINGFVDRLPLNGLHIKSNCLRLTVHLRHGIVCTGRHAARHHHAGRAIPAIGNPSRGSRSTRSVTAWLKPPPIRAITDRWLHDSSDNSLDFHRGQVGVGSGLFHGNTSYGDGVLHLKVESKVYGSQATSHGSGAATKTPMVCCASSCPRAWIFQPSARLA